MKPALLDASVMVALFDDNDKHSGLYRRKLMMCHTKRICLMTTWPCITEASYLLSPRNHLALLTWFHQGGAEVVNFDTSDLEQIIKWMAIYTEPRKTMMDLADASLVWLAMHANTTLILTEDKRDFLRYRLPDGRAFEIL